MGAILSAQDFAGAIGGAPGAGAVRVGDRTVAGADLLAMRAAQGIERIVQADVSRTALVKVEGTGGAFMAYTGLVSNVFGSSGTLTARAPAAASMATRAKRTGLVSAATAGSLSGLYGSTALFAIGNGSGLGGFRATFRFVVSDAATVSGARMFVGLSGTTAAPTNAEPSGLTNQIGVAQLSGSANLQLVYGGSAAQAAIDLGANFPAGGISTDLYELILFSDPNDNSRVGYRVERLNTGNIAEGTIANVAPGTTLPATATMLAIRHWRTNNATALAVGLDIVSAAVVWDF